MKTGASQAEAGRFAGGASARATAGLVAALLGVFTAGAAPIRNVILLIGDGMGAGQVAAARCYAGTNLVFESFPWQSRLSTLAAGGVVTDSAAASSALATGRKVYIEVVSLALPGGGEELETVLERSSRLDKSTGLVTSSYLTDATPAGFGAHTAYRYNWSEIADGYMGKSRPDVLLGGGGTGLSVEAAQAAGYRVVTNAEGLAALSGSVAGRVAGLFGEGAMPYVSEGVVGLPSLAEMTTAAIGLLSRDPDGFFLMVEGGRIDHACHEGNLYRCVTEALAFNEAVAVVAAWAQGRSDTLVVVTADHETGGLDVLADRGPGELPDVVWRAWGQHTADPVTAYAFGVNAQKVALLADNTELLEVLCGEALMPATGVGIEWREDGGPLTRWAVNSGDVCRVEYTPSLTPPAWEPCGVVTAETTRLSWPAVDRPAGPSGYYRVLTLPAGGTE